MRFEMPERRRAFRQAFATARVLIGWLGRSPGKSHTFGPSAFQ
jgi:hypothetical protein